jgi:hypothetical protein
MHIHRVLIAFALFAVLAGCGNNPPGPKGDSGPAGQMGPAGPKGDPGPAGLAAASAIRIIRSNCDATSCAAQCGDDEVMLIAYCGATRNPAAFPTERSASCRLRNPANSPLIAACAKASIQ